LIGATLVKEVFARSAYGCRLYCCWCAQDLDANYFWESLGFVPIAFRAGSTGKKRVHIFWQRRIDTVTPSPNHPVTPYWYPFQTNSGAIREDRIVFPIPPGVHWKDVRAVAVPRKELSVVSGPLSVVKTKNNGRRTTDNGHVGKVGILVGGRIKYVAKPGYVEPVEKKPVAKPKREPKVKAPAVKIDPKYLAAARELRDRYLEHVNSGVLPSQGKYDVGRALEGKAIPMPGRLAERQATPVLPAPVLPAPTAA
jgi:hypothetical protein